MTDQEMKSDKSGKGVQVHVFGRTDVGVVRDHNEDNFLIADLSRKNRSIRPEVQRHVIGKKGSIFAVCDGMGGAAAGEVASQVAVDTIYDVFQAAPPPEDDVALARTLNAAICQAATRIFDAARDNTSQRGMGTTATVAVVAGTRLLFGQVGDSRAHIVREKKMVQTTKDQSLVQQLIDAKQLTIEEAKNFDRSNIILQALGTSDEVHVDITSVELCRGDVLVMCSDGLSGLVEPDEIEAVVNSIEEPKKICQTLTDMACDNGGDDNVTVIVARFDGESLPEASSTSKVAYCKFYDPRTDRAVPPVPGGVDGNDTQDGGVVSPSKGIRAVRRVVSIAVGIVLVGLMYVWWERAERDGNAVIDKNSPDNVVVPLVQDSGVDSIAPSKTSEAVPEGEVEIDDLTDVVDDVDSSNEVDPLQRRDAGIDSQQRQRDTAEDSIPSLLQGDLPTGPPAMDSLGGVGVGVNREGRQRNSAQSPRPSRASTERRRSNVDSEVIPTRTREALRPPDTAAATGTDGDGPVVKSTEDNPY